MGGTREENSGEEKCGKMKVESWIWQTRQRDEKGGEEWRVEKGLRKAPRCFSMQLICILISEQETNQLIQFCLSVSLFISLPQTHTDTHRRTHPEMLMQRYPLPLSFPSPIILSFFLILDFMISSISSFLSSNHPSICPSCNHFRLHCLSQLIVKSLCFMSYRTVVHVLTFLFLQKQSHIFLSSNIRANMLCQVSGLCRLLWRTYTNLTCEENIPKETKN